MNKQNEDALNGRNKFGAFEQPTKMVRKSLQQNIRHSSSISDERVCGCLQNLHQKISDFKYTCEHTNHL